MLSFLLILSALCQLAWSKTAYYKWDIGWVTAAPDGFARPVIGINGEWPCPQVDVTIGDTVIVDVYNGLGNQTTGLHWHGIHQKGTGYMDGSSGVTQCGILPGESLRYEFVVNQSGTYWYHSHNMGQYPDGLWGPFIVHDPNFPYAGRYDKEFTITLTDWYHEQMPNLLQTYESRINKASNDGDEPTPDVALINAKVNATMKVEPNTTYLIRVICVGNWPGHAFLFDDHEMNVIEVDGVWIKEDPTGKKNVRVATGQRMSILLTTKNDTSKNYAFWDTMDINMLFLYEGKAVPPTFPANSTAWLVYNEDAPLPPPPVIHEFDFIDDVSYIPYDEMPLLEPVDRQIIMDMNQANINGVQRFTINNSTYLPQKVPSLYTALSVGDDHSLNPTVYGQVNPYVFKYGEVIEIIVNDYHDNLHPFHLHGHQFQVLERTAPNAGYWPGHYTNVSATPMRRDTIMLQQQGYTVIRFRADNPDKFALPNHDSTADISSRVWLFHCHIEWHVESGLIATFIEAPDYLGGMTIPQDHLAACRSQNTPTRGNAAGNLHHPLNMNGSVTTVPVGNYGATYPPPNGANSQGSRHRRTIRRSYAPSYPPFRA